MLATVPNTRIQFSNILFPTDFSVFSEAALPYAEALARRYDATLYPAHVVPPEPYHGLPMEPFPVTLDYAWRTAEASLADLAALEQLKDVHHQVLLKQGPFWDVISSMTEKYGVDLIVLGTHGRTGLSRLAMGSVAEEIYRHASCPVLCVGPKVAHESQKSPEFHRILFPTDFSEASQAALPYALTLAEESQARLVLLHLIPLVPLASQESVRMEAVEKLKALIRADAVAWCTPEFEVRFEFPAEGILAAARRHNSDVIVMGVHHSGHSRAVSHLPWAIPTEVVAQAKCPVLTVRG
jgi:nucleotide-binding universal stress UspA family protein